MKLAPMSYHYVRYPIEKFLDKVERSPFDSIDLYCSAPQLNMFDYPVSRLLELDKSIRRHHLSVMAMTPENCVYPVNFCTQDTLTRESSIRYYQRAIDTAQFLECPAIQISTGFGYFDMPREEAWKFCRESVGTLAAYAERKGVTLLLEELKVTTTNVLITSKDLAKMIAEIDSPAVVGMVDMDQMTYAGETIDDYFASTGGRFIWPADGGYFNGSLGAYRGHTGMDIACPMGTTVRASKAGTVTTAFNYGWNYGYGKTVVINHGYGQITRYAHMSNVTVTVGQYVKQGQVIGYSGSSGNSSGPHLHFEIHRDGVYLNPIYYVSLG